MPEPVGIAGRTKRVIAELDEAAKLAPGDPDVLLELGLLYQDMGDPAESKHSAGPRGEGRTCLIPCLPRKVASHPENRGLCRGSRLGRPHAGSPRRRATARSLAAGCRVLCIGPAESRTPPSVSMNWRLASVPSEVLAYLDGVVSMAKNDTSKAVESLEEVIRRNPQYAGLISSSADAMSEMDIRAGRHTVEGICAAASGSKRSVRQGLLELARGVLDARQHPKRL